MAENQSFWVAEYWQEYEQGGVVGVYSTKELAMEGANRRNHLNDSVPPLEFEIRTTRDLFHAKEREMISAKGWAYYYSVYEVQINEDLE